MMSLSLPSNHTGGVIGMVPVVLRAQRTAEAVEPNLSPLNHRGLDAAHPVVHPTRQVSAPSCTALVVPC